MMTENGDCCLMTFIVQTIGYSYMYKKSFRQIQRNLSPKYSKKILQRNLKDFI